MDGKTEVLEGIMMDWSLPSTPKIDSETLGLAMKGLFFKKDGEEVEPPVNPPEMPMHDDTEAAKLQVFMSNYLADSLCKTFLDVHGLEGWTMSK